MYFAWAMLFTSCSPFLIKPPSVVKICDYFGGRSSGILSPFQEFWGWLLHNKTEDSFRFSAAALAPLNTAFLPWSSVGLTEWQPSCAWCGWRFILLDSFCLCNQQIVGRFFWAPFSGWEEVIKLWCYGSMLSSTELHEKHYETLASLQCHI